MKECSRCKTLKDNDCFCKEKRSADKLSYYCKECRNKPSLSSSSISKIDKINGHKQCKECKQIKNLTDFRYVKTRDYFNPKCLNCENLHIHIRSIPKLKKEGFSSKRDLDESRGWKLCTSKNCKRKGQHINLIEFSLNKKRNVYYTKCIQCRREYDRLSRKTNEFRNKRNIKLKHQRKHDKKFIKTLKELRHRYHQRYKHSPHYKVNKRLTRQIWSSLKGDKNYRSWEDIVGYTKEILIQHLESLFTEGMTWEIFTTGKIHIDHILPKELFEFKDEHDTLFKLCWRLENLRPNWAHENISKKDKLPNGKLARNLSSEEKIDYLIELGLLQSPS